MGWEEQRTCSLSLLPVAAGPHTTVQGVHPASLTICHKGVTYSSIAKQSCLFPAAPRPSLMQEPEFHAPSCKPRSLKECQVTSWSYLMKDTTVADTADQTWHGATCKDSMPHSDPPGTAPWAEGLRCPSATCHAWGGFSSPPSIVPNWEELWMPPLA